MAAVAPDTVEQRLYSADRANTTMAAVAPDTVEQRLYSADRANTTMAAAMTCITTATGPAAAKFSCQQGATDAFELHSMPLRRPHL
jgi:hypothetical protein